MRTWILAFAALSTNAQPSGAKVALERPADALTTNTPDRPAGSSVSILSRGPDGKLQKLPVSHIFRGGESIELKVRCDIDAYLMLYVSDDAKNYVAVFPHGRFYGGSARIRKGEELTIPLTFDSQPGTTSLYLAILNEYAGESILTSLQAPKSTAPSYARLKTYIDEASGGKAVLRPEDAPEPLQLKQVKNVRWTQFQLTNMSK